MEPKLKNILVCKDTFSLKLNAPKKESFIQTKKPTRVELFLF